MDDQLLLTYNNVTDWLDAGFVVDLILFDLGKVFNVVNYHILIAKLRNIGVGGTLLNWLQDFLVDRHVYQLWGGKAQPDVF